MSEILSLAQKQQLDEAITEAAIMGSDGGGAGNEGGKFDFTTFCAVAAKFMIEEDEEQMREELREAFRIYDKEGNGYITTDVLREILHEIDPQLTREDLDGKKGNELPSIVGIFRNHRRSRRGRLGNFGFRR